MSAASSYRDHCGGYQCPLQGRRVLDIPHPAIAGRAIRVCACCKDKIEAALRGARKKRARDREAAR